MTPDELCAKGTESGEQKALFAWAAMATYRGFAWADDPNAYSQSGQAILAQLPVTLPQAPVPELKWLHAIPNGGKRDAATAALMKAEGVRVGVADVFLPVARKGCHGLYIEMKKIKDGRISPEQTAFADFVMSQGFHWAECRGWRAAATIIKKYLN